MLLPSFVRVIEHDNAYLEYIVLNNFTTLQPGKNE